jgi:hypothetical protein
MLYEAFTVTETGAHTIKYDNCRYNGEGNDTVETLDISIWRTPKIHIEEIYANITLKRIKGAFPTMDDNEVWEELAKLCRHQAEEEDKNSRKYKSRSITIQFVAFVILYRKYGAMFTLRFNDDDDDDDS